ncbi:PucR family transcriptional regulator [Saccharopolyspora sp. NPDC003752]
MPTVENVLTSPGLAGIRVLGGPVSAGPVTGVRLEHRLDRVPTLPAGCIAVLLAPVSGYRLDIAVRDASTAGAAALALTGQADELPPTARALADNGRVCILHATGDLAALVVAIARTIDGDAADALARVEAAAQQLPRTAGNAQRSAALAAELLGVPVEARAAAEGEDGAVAVGAEGEVQFAAPRSAGHHRAAVRSVLTMAALVSASGSAEDIPVRSRSQLLAELLVAPEDTALQLAPRGRALGLPIDAWHIALRTEPAALTGTDRFRMLEAATPEALSTLRTSGAAQWNAARVDDALVLLRSQPTDPRREGMRIAFAEAERLLGSLRERFPAADIRCGVGTPHRGPLGVRTSAREARSALLRGRGPDTGPVSAHDAVGLDRMLLEWYSSDAAREAVDELLSPVLALGNRRAEPLLRTLQSYLDHQGSPARAAEELHVHRNVVGRRVRRVTELMGIDLDDPQQRLKVQLACRAHLT